MRVLNYETIVGHVIASPKGEAIQKPPHSPRNKFKSSNFEIGSKVQKFKSSNSETPKLRNFETLKNSETRKPNSVAAQNLNLKVGMRVEHQKFGVGTVISIEGFGDNAKAHIAFDDAGERMLMLRFAVLNLPAPSSLT